MRIIILVLLLITLSINLPVSAAVSDINQTPQPKISVVAFINNDLLKDPKAMEIINSVLSQKFIGQNITIANDNKPKSPAFMEFLEQVRSDPVNEKDIYYIGSRQLADYGQNTGSDYTVLISITKNRLTNGNTLKLSLIDVKTQKSLVESAWHASPPHDFRGTSALKDLTNKFSDDFCPSPTDDIIKKENIVSADKKKCGCGIIPS